MAQSYHPSSCHNCGCGAASGESPIQNGNGTGTGTGTNTVDQGNTCDTGELRKPHHSLEPPFLVKLRSKLSIGEPLRPGSLTPSRSDGVSGNKHAFRACDGASSR